MLTIFPEKNALKEESTQRFWNLVFNATVGSIDKLDKDQGFCCTRR